MSPYLDKIFNPKSVAVIGASDKAGTVGYAIIRNLINSDFQGTVFATNPKYKTIAGIKSYPSVLDISIAIDLAIIATPAKVVTTVLKQCGEAGIKGVVIISAGFKEIGKAGTKRLHQVTTIAEQYGIRIMGPNCLGFINTSIALNASFASNMPLKGKMAFISQSGALCTSILDWSITQSVGFSHFVSIGSMIDIGFHDLIDYFGSDPNTSCILIYMESLQNPRRFMSAARAFAKHKPIIVLKAGKSEEGAKASLSHTGVLAGNDKVYQTALKRAGIIQVDNIAQLFNMAQALDMQARPKGNGLVIVTNSGGPGILATDHLIKNKGTLAELSKKTIKALDKKLSKHWSHGNPVDILGDASAQMFKEAVDICLKDPNVDAVLTILCPVSVTKPSEVAKQLVQIDTKKTLLTCWMGEEQVQEGREILELGRIPNYRFPEEAVDVFLKMNEYTQNLALLQEMPSNIPEMFSPQKTKVRLLINQILQSGRTELTETEAKNLLSLYDIPVPSGMIVSSEKEAVQFANQIGFPVVMKIESPEINHKIDVGGIFLNIKTPQAVKDTYQKLLANAQLHCPSAKIHGVRIEQQINKKYELLIGAKRDPVFGPVIIFGAGGTLVELIDDTAMALPPLNMSLAKRMINQTKISKLLKGYRSMEGVDIEALQLLLVKFAYLLMDFPEIQELDINPFVVDKNGGVALDAHIILKKIEQPSNNSRHNHLVISLYQIG